MKKVEARKKSPREVQVQTICRCMREAERRQSNPAEAESAECRQAAEAREVQ